MPDNTDIKVDIESLRKDIENVNTIHNRLDTAIDRLDRCIYIYQIYARLYTKKRYNDKKR